MHGILRPSSGRYLVAFGAVAFAALLLANAAVLLPACGLLGGTNNVRTTFCPVPIRASVAESNDARDKQAALAARLESLRVQLGERECKQVSTVDVTPVDPPSTPAIPEEDWREEKLDVLQGCWDLDSDYTLEDIETGTISYVESWRMCFDEQGNGQQFLLYATGESCEAKATARFEGGRLVIRDLGNVECDDGSFIYQRISTCERSEVDGIAECIGQQPELPHTRSVFRLRR